MLGGAGLDGYLGVTLLALCLEGALEAERKRRAALTQKGKRGGDNLSHRSIDATFPAVEVLEDATALRNNAPAMAIPDRRALNALDLLDFLCTHFPGVVSMRKSATVISEVRRAHMAVGGRRRAARTGAVRAPAAAATAAGAAAGARRVPTLRAPDERALAPLRRPTLASFCWRGWRRKRGRSGGVRWRL